MRRISILLLGIASLLGSVNSASACGYGMAGPWEQFLASDFIILGKVKAVEDCTVMMNVEPGTPAQAQAQPFRVCTVSVVESLKGAQGLSAIRVGFQPGSEPRVGAEGCFYLTGTVHSFSIVAGGYVLPAYRDGNPNFDKSIEMPRGWAASGKTPAGLRSKDADDRLLTAALLLSHYRAQAAILVASTVLNAGRERLFAHRRRAESAHPRGPGHAD